MASTQKGSGGTSLGLWTKASLWTLVVVFGGLYLSSGRRSPEPPSPTPAVVASEAPAAREHPGTEAPPDPEAATAEIKGEAQPAETTQPAPDRGADGTAGEVPSERSGALADTPEPVRAAESAAFVESLRTKAPPEGPASEAPGQTGTASQAAPEADAAVTTKIPTLPRASHLGSSTDLGAEIRAPAESVITRPPAKPGGAAPPPGATAAPATGVGPSQEAERARIFMEYEAMGRTAEEEMRRSWYRMVMPPQGGMPYGGSGYGSGPRGYPNR